MIILDGPLKPVAFSQQYITHAHLRPFIKVNSLIAYDNGDDRITDRFIKGRGTNGQGRRGCDEITDYNTLTDSSEIKIDTI